LFGLAWLAWCGALSARARALAGGAGGLLVVLGLVLLSAAPRSSPRDRAGFQGFLRQHLQAPR
jgi:hypothetical protein